MNKFCGIGGKLNAKKKSSEESWQSVVKAISLKCLATGKFWQLGWFLVLGLLIWRMESAGIVEIARLFVDSGVYCVIGWILFVVVSLASVGLFKLMRRVHAGEIDRLVVERNDLQRQLTNGSIQSSIELKKIENKKS